MPTTSPLHRCSACGRAVIVLDGHVIRACPHEAAPVVGEMRAHVVSMSSLAIVAAREQTQQGA